MNLPVCEYTVQDYNQLNGKATIAVNDKPSSVTNTYMLQVSLILQ